MGFVTADNRTRWFLHKAESRRQQAVTDELLDIYQRMERQFGDRGWWPAESAEEIVIGAILVQSVSWKNVENAIENLRRHGLLSLASLHEVPPEVIEPHIKPTLYFRMKARKLAAFANHVHEFHQGDLGRMLCAPLTELRAELLGIYGIGEETADDIILYAALQPSFVIDAYTKRIFYRLGYVEMGIAYKTMQEWFMEHLSPDTQLYNQYHALLDAVGSHYCSSKSPQCSSCPLERVCDFAEQFKGTKSIPEATG